VRKILMVDGELAKSHVAGYTKKDGTFVKEHDDNRAAAKPKKKPFSPTKRTTPLPAQAAAPAAGKNPDHGVMTFTHRSGMGNVSRLSVSGKHLDVVGGQGMKVSMSPANYMRHSANAGHEANRKAFYDAVRNAYNNSGGDPEKVLAAVRSVTKAGHEWSAHDHIKPAAPAAPAKKLVVDKTLAKAHVAAFTRKDGTFVKEHDNGRQAAQAKPAAATRANVNSSDNQSAHSEDLAYVNRQIKKLGLAKVIKDFDDLFAGVSHMSSEKISLKQAYEAAIAAATHAKKALDKDKAPAFDHPTVVGHASDHKVLSGSSEVAGNGDLTDKGSTSMKFGGKTYNQTSKTGTSRHDGTPLTAYEHEESGHRVWGDAKGRVHADSTSEVGELRAAGAKAGQAAGAAEKDPKAEAKAGIDKHLSGMKPGESKSFVNAKGRFSAEKVHVTKNEDGYTIKNPFGASSNHDHEGAVNRLHNAFDQDGAKEAPASVSDADLKAKKPAFGSGHDGPAFNGEKNGPSPAAKARFDKAAGKAQVAKTKNAGNGFHGEALNAHLRNKHGSDNYYSSSSQEEQKSASAHADKRFAAAAQKLVEDGHFESHEKAGEYLDSRHGRHLHDGASAHGGDVSKVPWLKKDVAHFKKTGGKPF
jgi:hypothetical protein